MCIHLLLSSFPSYSGFVAAYHYLLFGNERPVVVSAEVVGNKIEEKTEGIRNFPDFEWTISKWVGWWWLPTSQFDCVLSELEGSSKNARAASFWMEERYSAKNKECWMRQNSEHRRLSGLEVAPLHQPSIREKYCIPHTEATVRNRVLTVRNSANLITLFLVTRGLTKCDWIDRLFLIYSSGLLSWREKALTKETVYQIRWEDWDLSTIEEDQPKTWLHKTTFRGRKIDTCLGLLYSENAEWRRRFLQSNLSSTRIHGRGSRGTNVTALSHSSFGSRMTFIREKEGVIHSDDAILRGNSRNVCTDKTNALGAFWVGRGIIRRDTGWERGLVGGRSSNGKNGRNEACVSSKKGTVEYR